MYRQWDVWLATVAYEDRSESSNRPVLILDYQNNSILAIKMTKTLPRDNNEYRLLDWQAAGLSMPTTVRTHKLLNLRDSDMMRKIGTLSVHDILAMQSRLMM